MTIPRHVIEKAIAAEGRGQGWAADAVMVFEKLKMFGVLTHEEYCSIALDPLFWQAIGKALGWADWYCMGPEFLWSNDEIYCRGSDSYNLNQWQYETYRFYDLILTGGDTEKFWNEIMPTP